jgi:hypothetical protein
MVDGWVVAVGLGTIGVGSFAIGEEAGVDGFVAGDDDGVVRVGGFAGVGGDVGVAFGAELGAGFGVGIVAITTGALVATSVG